MCYEIVKYAAAYGALTEFVEKKTGKYAKHWVAKVSPNPDFSYGPGSNGGSDGMDREFVNMCRDEKYYVLQKDLKIGECYEFVSAWIPPVINICAQKVIRTYGIPVSHSNDWSKIAIFHEYKAMFQAKKNGVLDIGRFTREVDAPSNWPPSMLGSIDDKALLEELENRNLVRLNFKKKDDDGQEFDCFVFISCLEFLDLTGGIKFLVEEGGEFQKDRVKEWEDTPHLEVDHETGEVLAHEGRHRVAAMVRSMYTHTVIGVVLSSKKFIQEQMENFSLEKVEEFSKTKKTLPNKFFRQAKDV